ncbi:PspA/IM30 family protein [Rhodobacteraceae bacterium RKSG542]|uniref:PspA/IM30 family protein n=1 Tax=Pseudovibrio flavus TaxID=2529854 RepID=UPI0012BD3818|nr:PspA/IM30 family protein [Pseudovibrio flavus]MTI15805.1 PspA/IM30 family protein [Pseudovibrio flavus]
MGETLISRVGRLVSGTATSIIEAVENKAPDIVMGEAIREIEEAVTEVRGALGDAAVRRHHASQRLSETNRSHEELAEKITLALANGKDDLAKAGIARQIDLEAQIPILEKTVVEASEEEKELDNSIKALQARKREMQEQLSQYQAIQREQAAVASREGANAPNASDTSSKVENATNAFDRALSNASGVAIQTGSTTSADSAKLAELEQLSRDHRIEERLAAFKAKAEAV